MIKEGQNVRPCKGCGEIAFIDCKYHPQAGHCVICGDCGVKSGGHFTSEIAFDHWNNDEVKK